MNRLKYCCLLGGTILFGMAVLLLPLFVLPSSASFQYGDTSTLVTASTPRATATLTLTTTITANTTPEATPTQPPSPLDSGTYETLISHFEKVSTEVLDIAKWVVILVGGLGGASGIIGSYLTIGSRKKIEDLEKEIATLESRTGRLIGEIEEGYKLLQDATNRMRYVLELRDSNYEVRVRAVQQLGASNDIAAVSYLVEALEKDHSLNVRAEAAWGLGQLLASGKERQTLRKGLQSLVKSTKHKSDKVRRAAVEALDTLVCSGVRLTYSTVQKLHEIVEVDESDSVIKATKDALEHIKQQREGTLNSQNREQES